ncbi:unnamed protein product [Lymnaea stagnalis]|uniref:Secreted protein n=1 Tax=Lymnaea stagnalis TaxID=6523 RepID=A0AAV2IJS1_LYMST
MNCAPLLAALVSLVMGFGGAEAQPPTTLCTGVQANSNNFKHTLVYVPGAVKVESVDLVSQQSGSPCTKGVSYGFVGPDVYVDKGCRAIFNACYIPGINQQITCSNEVTTSRRKCAMQISRSSTTT